MAKLTKKGGEPPKIISSHLSSPFSLCFKYKLEKGYTFDDMTVRDTKEFQKFLDIAAQLSFEQAERRYRRKSDTNDTLDGEQIIHYGIGEDFRIHGIIDNAQFVVLRLDPNHKFHG